MELLTKQQHTEKLNSILESLYTQISENKAKCYLARKAYLTNMALENEVILYNALLQAEKQQRELFEQLRYVLYLETNLDSIMQMGVNGND